MPLRTVATEMLGIEYPIVCGGMTATGSAELCAAVSNAGGLGMLTCLHCRTPENLQREISRARELTSKPFGVNLTILGEKRGEPEFPTEFTAVITKNNIQIVETCGGGVALMSEVHRLLRAGGVRLILSKCVTVKSALVAQDKLACDMVSLMGADSGGLPGEGDTGVWVQMALAHKALRVPFLCSGGVATGSQLLAALASGAAGVQIGTRFNATVECNIWPASFKQRMVKAGVNDTLVIGKSFKSSSRVMRNSDAEEILKLEQVKPMNLMNVLPLIKFERLREGIAAQDPDRGVWNCGQAVALIDDVPTCQALVQRMIAEAEEQLTRVMTMFSRL